MAQTPRSSSLVENLNSRLRTYFTLRRHLGNSYLGLLRFFLNHRRFMRSRCAPSATPKAPRSDDRPRPSALADAAGPRTTSASARLTRREVNRLLHPTDHPRIEIRRPILTGRRLPLALWNPKMADSEPRQAMWLRIPGVDRPVGPDLSLPQGESRRNCADVTVLSGLAPKSPERAIC
ncbi:MAG: hypothetical protein JWQ55_4262 [Rhodopila sp.]|jgi:hypothetical protein|nr:hypothetical protein [Rhodopila sp.]